MILNIIFPILPFIAFYLLAKGLDNSKPKSKYPRRENGQFCRKIKITKVGETIGYIYK